ncbi:MAG: hypothetical protein RL001_1962, partial [Pseudomonadota bacterium]
MATNRIARLISVQANLHAGQV